MKKITLIILVIVAVFISFCGISPARADEYLWGKWRCELPETLKGLIINFGSEGRGTLEIGNQEIANRPNQWFFYYYIETILTMNEEPPEYIIKIWIPTIYSSDLKTMRILFREDGKIELTFEDKEETKLILSRIRQDL